MESTLHALLKGSTWLLQTVISIFTGQDEPNEPPPPPPSSVSYPPYGVPSRDACTIDRLRTGNSRYSIANQTFSQHSSPYPPYPQPSTLYSPNTPPQPRDPLMAKSLNYTQHPVDTLGLGEFVIDPQEGHESLRIKARREGDRMAECFQQSKEAFVRNDKKLAKELSLMGQAHKEDMTRLNKEASAKIFQENNQKVGPNTVDLHGLYVQEAEFYFKEVVQRAKNRAQSFHVIVGKGNHSDGKIPKIKPAIQALGESLGVTIDVDPVNDGCLFVSFGQSPAPRSCASLLSTQGQSVF